MKILLASQSPRRRQLIRFLGVPVHTVAIEADEDAIMEPDPAQNVILTAELKTAVVRKSRLSPDDSNMILITADTTVVLDGKMLNKPADEEEAEQMLRAMRDRTHEVHTGYVVTPLPGGQSIKGVHTAVVTMRHYSDGEMEAYIASGDPMDKAGAYAIQHPIFRPVARLEGCFLSVMGLPLCDLIGVLKKFDLPLHVAWTAVKEAHQQYPCPILPYHLPQKFRST